MPNSRSSKLLEELSVIVENKNQIDPEFYNKFNVKKGLRNSDGSGVLVGLTEIGEVHGYVIDEGEKKPDWGRLSYRGINVEDIVNGFQADNRYGFEEVCYLLLFGELPSLEKLADFNELLGNHRTLPYGFTEDMILKAPSNDIMNKLARSVLAYYSYDQNPDDTCAKNLLRQSIELIACFPTMMAYGYQAKSHYHGNNSLFIHMPKKELGTAENILHMIRPDNKYSKTEAELLDLALVLHAEHGGGNNSSFATRVVSSTGTDTYSAIAAAVGSLKGPKHGGANVKVMAMIDDIKINVSDWNDKDELERYLVRILKKEVGDKSGLIYGMGHAVYTLSDPRAILLKEKALTLAKETNREKEYNLYTNIESLSPKVFFDIKGSGKDISANVDFYSGFVYSMLNIPPELYTPIFAVSRIVGWCAHRIEELVSIQRIIRPAYKSVVTGAKYINISER